MPHGSWPAHDRPARAAEARARRRRCRPRDRDADRSRTSPKLSWRRRPRRARRRVGNSRSSSLRLPRKTTPRIRSSFAATLSLTSRASAGGPSLATAWRALRSGGAAMQTMKLGEVTISRVIEIDRSSFPTASMLPGSSAEVIAAPSPLAQAALLRRPDRRSRPRAIQTYVVRTPRPHHPDRHRCRQRQGADPGARLEHAERDAISTISPRSA